MKYWLPIVGILGATATIFGALGAHYLKNVLIQQHLNSFETAVRFQFFHTILLVTIGFWFQQTKHKFLQTAFFTFLVGIVLFSGSIYLLSTQQLTGIKLSFLGPVTPLGGIVLIYAWLHVGFSGLKNSLHS